MKIINPLILFSFTLILLGISVVSSCIKRARIVVDKRSFAVSTPPPPAPSRPQIIPALPLFEPTTSLPPTTDTNASLIGEWKLVKMEGPSDQEGGDCAHKTFPTVRTFTNGISNNGDTSAISITFDASLKYKLSYPESNHPSFKEIYEYNPEQVKFEGTYTYNGDQIRGKISTQNPANLAFNSVVHGHLTTALSRISTGVKKGGRMAQSTIGVPIEDVIKVFSTNTGNFTDDQLDDMSNLSYLKDMLKDGRMKYDFESGALYAKIAQMDAQQKWVATNDNVLGTLQTQKLITFLNNINQINISLDAAPALDKITKNFVQNATQANVNGQAIYIIVGSTISSPEGKRAAKNSHSLKDLNDNGYTHRNGNKWQDLERKELTNASLATSAVDVIGKMEKVIEAMGDMLERLKLLKRLEVTKSNPDESYTIHKLTEDSLIMCNSSKDYYSFDTSDKRGRGGVRLQFIRKQNNSTPSL